MYELITLLKPFELLSEEPPEALLRKQQRPQIPKVPIQLIIFDNKLTFDYRKILLHAFFNVS